MYSIAYPTCGPPICTLGGTAVARDSAGHDRWSVRIPDSETSGVSRAPRQPTQWGRPTHDRPSGGLGDVLPARLSSVARGAGAGMRRILPAPSSAGPRDSGEARHGVAWGRRPSPRSTAPPRRWRSAAPWLPILPHLDKRRNTAPGRVAAGADVGGRGVYRHRPRVGRRHSAPHCMYCSRSVGTPSVTRV